MEAKVYAGRKGETAGSEKSQNVYQLNNMKSKGKENIEGKKRRNSKNDVGNNR